VLIFYGEQKELDMHTKSLVALGITAALSTAAATAAEQSPHSITGNMGLYSQYIFRGLTQTDRDPALQGGLDYSHSSGFYLGTWASNISWLRDFGSYRSGGSLEWDFYGGYKGAIGKSDFGFDVGLLQYYYPGDVTAGGTKADTLELYGALSWKWLSAKYSHSLDKKTFGVADSRNTWYLDLSANFPLTDKLNIQAHWGKQKFKGSIANVSNDSQASYEDWKLGVTYALPKDFTVGAYYTGTDMSAAQKAFYTTPAGAGSRFLGKDTFTVFLQKTF
jgi:uncharacterized protein (TIGR02001 family)